MELGDKLVFPIAGREIEIEITISSFRRVNRDSFQPNFFMVLSPGAIEDLRSTFISNLKIQPDQKDVLQRLVRQRPSVSVIDSVGRGRAPSRPTRTGFMPRPIFSTNVMRPIASARVLLTNAPTP